MHIKTTVMTLLTVGLMAVGCGGTEQPVDSSAAPEDTHTAQWRSCPDTDGTSCWSPGATFTCYNQYPYEPGLCYCRSDYAWQCN